MIKLQQFDILAYSYGEIRDSGYEIRVTVDQARESGNLVSVGDNETLRLIRRLTDHPYDNKELEELVGKRQKAFRSADSVESKELIGELNRAIDRQLFIGEFISVQFRNASEYKDLNRHGFSVNGKEYTWLMCGAGHQRTNRAMYVDKGIYEKLDILLRNGANLQEMVLAKYNAYYALASSATYKVSKPRVCVIPDLEITMTKLVDFIENGKIERKYKEMKFNVFDGQGLISPEFSKKWANDVGIYDYVPATWGVRCAFIKGMCVTFDFHKYWEENTELSPFVRDMWGNSVDIRNIDVVLTQSQFKLWNAYESWQDYETNLWVNGLSWGISKVSPNPNEEKTYMMTNYQFLQVLDLNDNQIRELCAPTLEWLNGVSCGDLQKTKLYLLGNIANKTDARRAVECVQDNFVKCLLMDETMLNDKYIQSRILRSIDKKTRETYFGNLIVEGNFMARISDPYALCEYLFGVPVKGLLKENEHYSQFWNIRKVDKVVAMRSPLTYKTEAHILNLQDNEQCNKWYSYLNSGVIYNIWGVDCMLEAGADYDYDIVATTNNECFLKGVLGTNIPVTYDAKKPEKKKITKEGLVEIAGVGFSPEIGLLTNHSTTFYDMQSKYEINSTEWRELENRLKKCCVLQSMQIDKAKGLEIEEIPQEWTKYGQAKKKDNGENGLNVELMIKHRPYFMRYRYDNYNREYKGNETDKRRYCIIVFGNENGEGFEDTTEYAEMEKYYGIKQTLSHNNGLVNKICKYMEDSTREMKKSKNTESLDLYEHLWGGTEPDMSKVADMVVLYETYTKFRQEHKLFQTEYVTWEQYFKFLRNKALKEISSNLVELAQCAVYVCYTLNPKKPKDFAWDCFGMGIVEKMSDLYVGSRILLKDTMGNVRYLGNQYWEYYVPKNDKKVENAYEIEDEISMFDSVDDALIDMSEIWGE